MVGRASLTSGKARKRLETRVIGVRLDDSFAGTEVPGAGASCLNACPPPSAQRSRKVREICSWNGFNRYSRGVRS
jgi:hypothetical protein